MADEQNTRARRFQPRQPAAGYDDPDMRLAAEVKPIREVLSNPDKYLPRERGEAYVALAMIYMREKVRAMKKYEAALDKAIACLKSMKSQPPDAEAQAPVPASALAAREEDVAASPRNRIAFWNSVAAVSLLAWFLTTVAAGVGAVAGWTTVLRATAFVIASEAVCIGLLFAAARFLPSLVPPGELSDARGVGAMVGGGACWVGAIVSILGGLLAGALALVPGLWMIAAASLGAVFAIALGYLLACSTSLPSVAIPARRD